MLGSPHYAPPYWQELTSHILGIKCWPIYVCRARHGGRIHIHGMGLRRPPCVSGDEHGTQQPQVRPVLPLTTATSPRAKMLLTPVRNRSASATRIDAAQELCYIPGTFLVSSIDWNLILLQHLQQGINTFCHFFTSRLDMIFRTQNWVSDLFNWSKAKSQLV